jgi:hypothetical protein
VNTNRLVPLSSGGIVGYGPTEDMADELQAAGINAGFVDELVEREHRERLRSSWTERRAKPEPSVRLRTVHRSARRAPRTRRLVVRVAPSRGDPSSSASEDDPEPSHVARASRAVGGWSR